MEDYVKTMANMIKMLTVLFVDMLMITLENFVVVLP